MSFVNNLFDSVGPFLYCLIVVAVRKLLFLNGFLLTRLLLSWGSQRKLCVSQRPFVHFSLRHLSSSNKNSASSIFSQDRQFVCPWFPTLSWRGRYCVENVKKLYHASLLSHGLFTWFNDLLQLTPTHSSRLVRKETHAHLPVVSILNSAIYGAIKHVPRTCLFGYV